MVLRKLILLGLIWPAWLLAHTNKIHSSDEALANSKLQIGLLFSASAYSSEAQDAQGLWRIPGLLMGGDALPNQQGAQLDAASLWARYQWQEQSALHAAIGTHAGHTDLSLENLYLDYQPANLEQISTAVGLMDASFSPSASSHPSARKFAETSLLADALWGGSIHDLALRLDWQVHPKLKFGLELRDGDFFPASKGEGAQVLFAQTEQTWQSLSFKAGVWGLKATAVQRGNDRYQAGHSHSTTGFTPPDVRFTGDSDLAGIWLTSTAAIHAKWQAGFDYEAVQAKSMGQLTENNYQAAYQADHLAYTLTPSLQYGAWNLSYRFEKLSLDNHLQGSGAVVLAQDANLMNSAQPQRQTLQLAWQANKNLHWRAAYTQDDTVANQDKRFSVGLVWEQSVYQY